MKSITQAYILNYYDMGVAVVAAPQSRLLTWQEQQWANELDMTGVEALLAPVTGIATPDSTPALTIGGTP